MLNVLVVIIFFRILNSCKKLIKQWWMIDGITAEKKVYIERKIITAYSAFLFLKISLRCCYVDRCLKFVGFLRGYNVK